MHWLYYVNMTLKKKLIIESVRVEVVVCLQSFEGVGCSKTLTLSPLSTFRSLHPLKVVLSNSCSRKTSEGVSIMLPRTTNAYFLHLTNLQSQNARVQSTYINPIVYRVTTQSNSSIIWAARLVNKKKKRHYISHRKEVKI